MITARQLAACGLNSPAITVRVRRGQLHRRHRGVYAVGTGVLTMRGEMTAAVLACGDDATLSHWSAGAWWAMVRWDGRDVDVIVRRGAPLMVVCPHCHAERAWIDARQLRPTG